MRPPDRTAIQSPYPADPSARDYPRTRAPQANTTAALESLLVRCRACPRLVAWREQVGIVKRAAYRDWDYWAKPVPGFGPPDAPVLIIGLAPAAHGGNRTGRIFTGDPSGDLLYATLHTLGAASQPTATRRGDGLTLRGVRITAPVRCAPPGNRPTPSERDSCRPWLVRELQLMQPAPSVVVALGRFAWDVTIPVLVDMGWLLPTPRPIFGHGHHALLTDPATDRRLHLLACYHPSRRNVSTRTLTPAMLRDVLHRALAIADTTEKYDR